MNLLKLLIVPSVFCIAAIACSDNASAQEGECCQQRRPVVNLFRRSFCGACGTYGCSGVCGNPCGTPVTRNLDYERKMGELEARIQSLKEQLNKTNPEVKRGDFKKPQ